MLTLTSSELATFANSYTIDSGPPKSITIYNAKKMRLQELKDITVSGTLLGKQYVRLDKNSGERTVDVGAGGGKYQRQSDDGDLHFCLGTTQGKPHIACELQNAKAWISTFNQSIGSSLGVSGFFRCMFEHPGFNIRDDAHVFEIHPIRAVSIDGNIFSFDVDRPDQSSIHNWTSPHDLNEQDSKVTVVFDEANDTLTFSNMVGQDTNYVDVKGTINQINLNENNELPSSFKLSSQQIGHPIQVYCSKGTSAAVEIRNLNENDSVSMIALRNIDLEAAFSNLYVVNLLAIDIMPS
jgi:hypothetical protein